MHVSVIVLAFMVMVASNVLAAPYYFSFADFPKPDFPFTKASASYKVPTSSITGTASSTKTKASSVHVKHTFATHFKPTFGGFSFKPTSIIKPRQFFPPVQTSQNMPFSIPFRIRTSTGTGTGTSSPTSASTSTRNSTTSTTSSTTKSTTTSTSQSKTTTSTTSSPKTTSTSSKTSTSPSTTTTTTTKSSSSSTSPGTVTTTTSSTRTFAPFTPPIRTPPIPTF